MLKVILLILKTFESLIQLLTTTFRRRGLTTTRLRCFTYTFAFITCYVAIYLIRISTITSTMQSNVTTNNDESIIWSLQQKQVSSQQSQFTIDNNNNNNHNIVNISRSLDENNGIDSTLVATTTTTTTTIFDENHGKVNNNINNDRTNNNISNTYNLNEYHDVIQHIEQSNSKVLVLIQQPESLNYNVTQLINTITDALSSPDAIVLVYLSLSKQHSKTIISLLEENFALITYQQRQQRLIILIENDELLFKKLKEKHIYLYDNLQLAYLLELASQTNIEYTLVLQAGSRLSDTFIRNVTATTTQTAKTDFNYVQEAIIEYELFVEERITKPFGIHPCWVSLSNNDNIPNGMFFQTLRHAHKMSIVLRSALPYKRKRPKEILYTYCTSFLYGCVYKEWSGMFTNVPALVDNSDLAHFAFVDEKQIPVPPWLHYEQQPVGPRLLDNTDYWIVFAINTMPRSGAGTEYVEQFMIELLNIVKTEFVKNKDDDNTSNNSNNKKEYSALIVLVACGTTQDETIKHREFLEMKYENETSQGLVRIYDSPVNTTLYENLPMSYPAERQLRRIWRSKQNIDVATTLRTAYIHKSDFVMLLEDDTGFQSNFVTALKKTLLKATGISAYKGTSVPTWSFLEFGFGYSGILIHTSDVPVFVNIHREFYDQHPCDILRPDKLIKSSKVRQIRNPKRYTNNGRTDHLRHFGKLSSLEGKVQEVWR